MSNANQLLINVAPSQVRAALIEQGIPVEIHIERGDSRSLVGNIYCGRVVRVLPGMQAAFVDIGHDRTGFLYVNDAIIPPPSDRSASPTVDESPTPSSVSATTPASASAGESSIPPRPQHRQPPLADIKNVLHEGQIILVQIQKDPLGTKGARLTRHIALPGRHAVITPFSSHVGISHRITDSTERERLKQAALLHLPSTTGTIVRTAAENIAAEHITQEIDDLLCHWVTIQHDFAQNTQPRQLFADLDLTLRIVRDFLSPAIARIVVDSPDAFTRIQQFIAHYSPNDAHRIVLHTDTQPLFQVFNIEHEINRMRDRRVWLKSGGYIVIDPTEALTVIDVNTGRFTGKSSLEDTMTQLNLEAAHEIAYQLRLRNLGGIIVIDFIDMSDPTNRERVITALQQALARDKAKSTIVGMSEIGLLQMTRKRVRESIYSATMQPCPYCQGRAVIKNTETIAQDLLRDLYNQIPEVSPPSTLQIAVHPDIAKYLQEKHLDEITHWQQQTHHTLTITPKSTRHHETYQFTVHPQAQP